MKQITSYLKEYAYLKSLQSMLHWDMETMMPKGAIHDRANRMAYVQALLHRHITAPHYQELLAEAQKQKQRSQRERKLLQELMWDYELFRALPEEHVKELSTASTMATHVWMEARKQKDFKLFLPHLQRLIELKQREASYFKVRKPYDALLRQFDKEFTSAQLHKLFKPFAKDLRDLTVAVKEQGIFNQVKKISGPFPKDKQHELSRFVAHRLGLPWEHFRLDESTHPFSINISPKDQRITTRYDEKHLDSLSSTIHEVGHALYEFNLPRDYEGTPLQEALSFSMHESQSRFWENIVGKSRSFAGFIHPMMKKLFPQNMHGIKVEDLHRWFNQSLPGPIRVESCELYYNFHIIIRFELEDLIFNQGLSAKELPQLWKEKYQAYLGLNIKNDAQGVLQDSHWAGAAFGYFPSYALGNLISASLFKKLKRARPSWESEIRAGDFSGILGFLKQKVHVHGRGTTTYDIIGELNHDDYINYLKDKFEL